MATTEPALAPKPQSSEPCSGGCATLGLENVVGFTQKLWRDVSHKPFLGCARWRPRGCVRGGPDCGRQLLFDSGLAGGVPVALSAPRRARAPGRRLVPGRVGRSRRAVSAPRRNAVTRFSLPFATNADKLSGAAT